MRMQLLSVLPADALQMSASMRPELATQRSADSTSATGDAAMPAVMQLHLAARAAAVEGASARAAQLRASALAAAHGALPADSLVTTALAFRVVNPHSAVQDDRRAPLPPDCPIEDVFAYGERVIQALRRRGDDRPEEERMLATEERKQLLLRCFEVLHSRWRAGTLHTPSADETTFFLNSGTREAPEVCGADLYAQCAMLAVLIPNTWPRECADDVSAAAWRDQRMRAVAGATRAALEAFARGDLAPRPAPPHLRDFQACAHPIRALDKLLEAVLTEERGLLQPLRSAHGLRRAEEAQLRALWAQRRNTFFPDGTVYTQRENTERMASFLTLLGLDTLLPVLGLDTDADACEAAIGVNDAAFRQPTPRGRLTQLHAAGVRCARVGRAISGVRPLPRRALLLRGTPSGRLAPSQAHGMHKAASRRGRRGEES
jgi:hypothetical protein